ncbi:helical backbone metal receptor [uncultured Pontibacter sp.]|uniref:ABC transporter substrate-binding protein n=1 Tax=uncultured Pontibacter sp. TaxID=453356 RepID=UPI0026274849|nr:helical backbone metal receptor [uncultured Pontibacter sp.]
MGYSIELEQRPQRIISLVPSQTELLFDLGLGDRVVGITKFCIHPKQQVKQVTKIGGTKNFNFDVIDQLQPDLIIGNKEENYQEGIEQLQAKYKVWMGDIYTLEDALEMITQMGQITGTAAKALAFTRGIASGFKQLPPLQPSIKTAYFIWRNPYMVVGSHNIIDHILQRCGFVNVFGQLSRYPEITTEQLQQANPQLILLSSEPYPFKEKHLQEFLEICPKACIKVVDGEMFSWYGSRLAHAPAYLQQVLEEVKRELIV